MKVTCYFDSQNICVGTNRTGIQIGKQFNYRLPVNYSPVGRYLVDIHTQSCEYERIIHAKVKDLAYESGINTDHIYLAIRWFDNR